MAGTQVITLTGDEASLFKAFQKIIDQQNKVDEGYKKTKDESKKASDQAVKDAERIERENKKAADSIFAEHQKMLDNKARETRQNAIEEQSIIRKAALQEVQDMTKAADQMIAEAEKVGREKRKLADEHTRRTKRAAEDEQKIFGGLADNIMGMATAYMSVNGALNMMQSIQSEIVTTQQASLDKVLQIAAAQQEAAKNMSGTNAAALSDTLQNAVPEIMRSSKFADQAKVTLALGSTQSIVGERLARQVVEEAAKITRLTPDQLQSTSTAVGDIMVAVPGLDAKGALAGMMTMGSVARPEDIPRLVQGAARSVSATIEASPTQDKQQAAREAMAIYAELTKVDPMGSSAATAEGVFVSELAKFFSTNTTDAETRNKKIKELTDKVPMQELQYEKSAITIQEAEKKAKRFGTKDTVEARDARMQVTIAKQAREDLAKQIADDAQELQKLKKQADFASRDPGTAQGRMRMIAGDKEARDLFTRDMRGETQFLPIMKAMLDPTSETFSRVQDKLKTITFDTKKWDEATQSVVLTSQQQVAVNKAATDAELSIYDSRNTAGATIADLRTKFNEVMAKSSIDIYTGASNAINAPIMSANNLLPYRAQIGSFQEALGERSDYLKARGASKDVIELVDNVRAEIAQAVTGPKVLESLNLSTTQQNTLVEEQNNILRQIRDGMQNNVPSANAIRNQVEQSRN